MHVILDVTHVHAGVLDVSDLHELHGQSSPLRIVHGAVRVPRRRTRTCVHTVAWSYPTLLPGTPLSRCALSRCALSLMSKYGVPHLTPSKSLPR